MESDPFGQALRDHYLGERTEPLLDRDGAETRAQPIQEWYFSEFDGDEFLAAWLDGPLIDLGAGVGRHARYFQSKVETVAIDISPKLIETMEDRGVDDTRLVDMFSLRDHFPRDRFASALAIGTQVTLAGSLDGIRQFLSDLAYVTTPTATAVVDSYYPDTETAESVFGYRPDPTPGLAYRVFHSQYENEIGNILIFRLLCPNRLREATIGTGWEVVEVKPYPTETGIQYRAALAKH